MRWIRRVGLAAVVLVLALISLGALYQIVGSASDRRHAPPPGRFVSVDGHRMHLHCTGEGSPTVVLEAGAIGFAQTWGWIQPELAKTTRVCSYDRPGMGWSETWEVGHDALTIAHHLHALLNAAGEPGPYVLVGHSLGGSLVRVYAERYPESVLAVGLIDPSHEDQLERFPPEMEKHFRGFADQILLASRLAHLGVLRATNLLGRDAEGLPEPDYRTARMFASSPGHLRASYEELAAWDATMNAVRQNRSLGDRPLLVVSATETMEGMPEGLLDINHDMHAELATLSARGEHRRIPGTDHYSLLMRREHALQVAASLEELVEKAR